MKKLNKFSIILALFAAVACSDSDKKTAEDAINNSSPQTTFTAQTDGVSASAVIGQAQHGTCTLSNDRSYMTYERTDLNYQGYDSCLTDENTDGCGGSYGIDFRQPTPTLTRYPAPC